MRVSPGAVGAWESRRLVARFRRGCGNYGKPPFAFHGFHTPALPVRAPNETASCFSGIFIDVFIDVRHFDVSNDMMCCCPGRPELPGFFTKGERNEGATLRLDDVPRCRTRGSSGYEWEGGSRIEQRPRR